MELFYENKLKKHQDEHDEEIVDNKERHENLLCKLKSDWTTYEQNQKALSTKKQTLERERDHVEECYLSAQNKRKDMVKLLEDKARQIQLLELENQEVIEKLKKRATDLYKYKFKIKDLRKSKHVLTHRTQEMRASLEPKDKQIDNL